MNSLAKLRSFTKDNYPALLFAVIAFLVIYFSMATLTTWPKLWVDEALTLDLAHNFSKAGVLNVETAPGAYFEFPYLLQSTGYPLTTLLGSVFSIFGYSFAIARVVMLILMIVSLLAVFSFGRKMFGRDNAILSVLLIATFASFYGSGRSAVGEIPGFIFLLLSLDLLLIREKYFFGGLMLGLAIAIKPSVFLLALPAMVVMILTERDHFIAKCSKLGLGVALPIMAWIYMVIGNPFAERVWSTIFGFYKDPYHSGSASGNVLTNLHNFFDSSTLIYFAILFALVCAARYLVEEKKIKLLFNFIITYTFIAFVYYLRSPGWLRYILIAELLIFLVLPYIFSLISRQLEIYLLRFKITAGQAAVIVAVFLAFIQLVHLTTGSEIYYSDAVVNTAQYINDKFAGDSISLMNAPELSVLVASGRRYQAYTLMGIPSIGSDPLLAGAKPQVAVYGSGIDPAPSALAILESDYEHTFDMNGYNIFTLKK